MFREVSQTSLGLEKAGLDSGFSPAACCQVEVEAEGRSELWWSVWSWGQWTPSSLEGQGDPLCGLERLDRVSLQSLALFLISVCI